jgi:hypothetical protein
MLMKRLKMKALIAAGLVTALILTVQIGTYCWYAESVMPRAGIRSLVDYGLVRGKDFVVLEPEVWNQLTDSQKRVLSKELGTNRLIYHSVEEVPDSGKIWIAITQGKRDAYERAREQQLVSPAALQAWRREIESGRRLAGFKKGIRVGWRLEASGLFWMRCQSSHWVSLRGAENRSDVYVWVLGGWVRIHNLYIEES